MKTEQGMGRTSTMCVCGDNQECATLGAGNMFVPHTNRRTGEPCPGIPQPKGPTGSKGRVVAEFLTGLTPDHTWQGEEGDAYVWAWSTPAGVWKIEYRPNFLGTIFNTGGASVTVTGPGLALTVAADETGLGICGAILRTLGAVEEGDPDG